MIFLKKWKTNWELKSLTFEELKNIIIEVVIKQLNNYEKNEITLASHFGRDYGADSVEIVAMLISLEDMFENASKATPTVVPTDKVNQIVLVEDLFDTIYEILVGIENKMDPFVPFKPDFEVLNKHKIIGEFY